MKILAIETSCDETAVAILECEGDLENASIEVLGNALYSQAEKHALYGGVYPALAKREHQENLVPLTTEALKEAGLYKSADIKTSIENIRDEAFKNAVEKFLTEIEKPDIDLIAVTKGPGLEPALWTGINFAEAIGKEWNIPVLGIDHMEGHIVSALLKQEVGGGRLEVGENAKALSFKLQAPSFPVLSLLVSGGHTQLVLMRKWFEYEHIGNTKDDAAGEAFDKVARLLDLPYPGGPKIAEAAKRSRERGGTLIEFPRPMANDDTCDFSFSGLKTAVLYKLQKMDKLSEMDKEEIAEAFENAARDVIVIKTKRALYTTGATTLIVGGGVSANEEIRGALTKMANENFSGLTVLFPQPSLTGDNAIMIGAAAYLRHQAGFENTENLLAKGNLKL